MIFFGSANSVVEAVTPYLPYISPTSPPYLAYISELLEQKQAALPCSPAALRCNPTLQPYPAALQP